MSLTTIEKTSVQHKSASDCPSCGAANALGHQSFCAECGYFPTTAERIEAPEELVRGPSMIGSIIVFTGMFLLLIAGFLGRVYIWDSGEHHYWMRYLLIVGGAMFALGHLAAFWHSMVKNGLDPTDIVFSPKGVWGPVLFEMDKKWITAALGVFGLTVLLVGGACYGVTYESYLSKSSNKSLWKLVEDIQAALGKEPTPMPEISFEKLEGGVNLPQGGEGELVLDGDLSALNPENLETLAEALGGDGSNRSAGGDASFADLANSVNLSELSAGATEKSGGSFTDRSNRRAKSANPSRLVNRSLKRNELECFIFGYTQNEAGELADLLMGSVINGEPVYIGPLPSEKISSAQLSGVDLSFFKETVDQPFVQCKEQAIWLKPQAICVVEHQGQDRKGIYLLNRFVGFREFL